MLMMENRQTDDLPNWNRFLRKQLGEKYKKPGMSEKRTTAESHDKHGKRTGKATSEIKVTP